MVAPSTDSPQGWIATALTTTAAAGSQVVITDEDGDEVATYTIQKDLASIVLSSVDIEPGASHTGGGAACRRAVAPAGVGAAAVRRFDVVAGARRCQ